MCKLCHKRLKLKYALTDKDIKVIYKVEYCLERGVIINKSY